MTTEEIILAIAAGTGLVNMCVGVLTFWTARTVYHATNSMKDELVATARSDATQKGEAKGRAAQRAEDGR